MRTVSVLPSGRRTGKGRVPYVRAVAVAASAGIAAPSAYRFSRASVKAPWPVRVDRAA